MAIFASKSSQGGKGKAKVRKEYSFDTAGVGVAKRRKDTGELPKITLKDTEYIVVKRHIDAKRKEMGIKVDEKNYLPQFRVVRKKVTLEDVLSGYRSTKGPYESETTKKIDEAFRLFYESGCTMSLAELAERVGLHPAQISSDFSKAGISMFETADRNNSI